MGVSTNWVDKVGGNNGTLYGGTHHNDGPFAIMGIIVDGTRDNLSNSSASSLGGFSGDFYNRTSMMIIRKVMTIS